MPFFESEYHRFPCEGLNFLDKDEGTLCFPSDKTKINNDEFYDCWELADAKIPEGVTEIGDRAFYNCRYMYNLSLPSTLKKIGKEAFARCSLELKKVEIPEGISSLEEGAFRDCQNLESVVLPESLLHIKKNAFAGCYRLNKIVFHNCFMVIDRSAFVQVPSFCKVFVPADQKIPGTFKTRFAPFTQFVPYEREVSTPAQPALQENEIEDCLK